MNLPRNPDPFLLKGFSLRQLYEGDKAQMMRMQDEVLLHTGRSRVVLSFGGMGI